MIGLALAVGLATAPIGQVASIQSDPRLRTVAYDADQVVRLQVAMGFQATLVLSPDERVENIAIGDADAWEVTPSGRGDVVFVKPLQAGGSTNLTVVTDGRLYSFELTATSGASLNSPYTLRFVYPQPVETAAPDAAAAGRYRVSGARDLRPSAISDDGERTFVEWTDAQTLPAIFALDARGRETLINGRMVEGRFEIDGVHPTLIFRLDRQTARATRQRDRKRS